MEPKCMDIKTIETPGKGKLSFFEMGRDIPFTAKRIYYITGTPKDVIRGGHAHRNLTQLLFCPDGSIEIFLDNGSERASAILDSPEKALVVESMIWRDMKWLKEGSTHVVVASDFYDESDYIRDYEEFLSECNDRLRG